jgi:hypothetical protein
MPSTKLAIAYFLVAADLILLILFLVYSIAVPTEYSGIIGMQELLARLITIVILSMVAYGFGKYIKRAKKPRVQLLPEVYNEPVILSSKCTLAGDMASIKYLLLTNLELVIRTPNAPERDICIPVNSITKIEVTKRIMEKTLSIYTNQTKYKLHYVKKLDEWASKLNQLLKQKDAGQKVG